MHLADAFIQSDLYCISKYTFEHHVCKFVYQTKTVPHTEISYYRLLLRLFLLC